jgi:hypothetical protein
MARRLGFLIAILLLVPAAAVCQEGAREVCPVISVMCPAEEWEPGMLMTFSATVSGGDPGAQFTFNWTVSAGTIVSGQGTPIIAVDTASLGGMSVKATVRVGGLPESCASSESCQTNMRSAPLPWHPFDRWSDLKFDDEKARLDNFAIALQSEPSATGYVLMFAGERFRPAEVKRRAKRSRSYLTNTRGIAASRVVLVYGGYKESGYEEGLTVLWIVPRGLEFPFPGEIIK